MGVVAVSLPVSIGRPIVSIFVTLGQPFPDKFILILAPKRQTGESFFTAQSEKAEILRKNVRKRCRFVGPTNARTALIRT
jgi:hypothetical protein